MSLKVRTYDGCKAPERPISFAIDDTQHFIEEVVEQWVGENYNYWKVKTDKKKYFVLKYDFIKDVWEYDVFK